MYSARVGPKIILLSLGRPATGRPVPHLAQRSDTPTPAARPKNRYCWTHCGKYDQSADDFGRVANPRLVATIKELATGRVVQRQVLTRMVGYGETGFLGRSSDLTGPVGTKYVFTRPVLDLQRAHCVSLQSATKKP